MAESEVVERVARAICASDFDGDETVYDTMSAEMQGNFHINARAAIEAMREPTHRMTVAGHSALDDTEHTQTKALGSLMGRMAFSDVWRAMIDAALVDSPTHP